MARTSDIRDKLMRMSPDEHREHAKSLMLAAAILFFDDRDTYFALAEEAFDTVAAVDHQLPR